MNTVIVTNHFQYQDGVCRAAIGLSNTLSGREGINVTIMPLFKFDKSMMRELDSAVKVEPIFRIYFRGFQRIIGINPKALLHKLFIGSDYDVEIGFCMKLPIQLVASAISSGEKTRNTKYLAWMHGYDEGLELQKEYEKIGKVICVSKYNAERLKRECNGRFEVNYAYNIVDDNNILSAGQMPIDIERPDGLLFCSVGRLTPEKGYVRLVRVIKRLNKIGYKFTFWLIGDGPEKKYIEDEINKYNIDNMVLLGKKDNPHAYTSKSDIFVCSSFSEGYSTACTEAVILGVPVITTDVAGANEIISDARSGIVVENSEDGLYEGMKTVLCSEEVLLKWKRDISIGKRGFSIENRTNRILDILNQ